MTRISTLLFCLLSFVLIAGAPAQALAQFINEPKEEPEKKVKKKKKPPICAPGKVVVKGQCCWPDQVWDKESRSCRGVPQCPEGMEATGEECQLTDPDGDQDFISDKLDKCPSHAEDLDGFEDLDGCPEPDNDKDGLADKEDSCPDKAEDPDGVMDQDGCPEFDADQDRIPDEADACPLEAEDKDAFEDEDGCPDLDNDKDSFLDEEDECPNHREDQLGPLEGCPEPDRDQDGFADLVDPCPDLPEDFTGARDGCPDFPMETGEIVGWTLLGVGGVAALTSLGMHLLAESDRDIVRDAKEKALDSGELVSDITQRKASWLEEQANQGDTFALASLIGAATFVAIGTTLILWPEDHSDYGKPVIIDVSLGPASTKLSVYF